MQVITIDEPRQRLDREVIIGIDFGTTNSLASVFDNGKCVVIPQEDGDVLLPSIIGVKGKDVIIGKEARKCKGHILSIKRIIAKKAGIPGSIRNDPQEMCTLSIGYASRIFASLKRTAEKYLGHCVNMAVVTVPAYFDNASRTAIKDAATIAGLNVVRLLSEPTAAALFYGIDEKKEEGRYIVYDLGGGTFDVSILEFHKGIFKVSCTDGDDYLGGDNFDQELLEHLLKKCVLEPTDEEKAVLLGVCMKIKEELSRQDRVTHYFDYRGQNICFEITLDEFEKIIEKDVEKTINIVKRALRASSLSVGDIDGLLLVGGSTMIPMIRSRVSAFFGEEKVVRGVNPETIVACGAALMGSFLNGKNPKRVLLLDVLPLSLGIETLDGTMEKIIMKDTPIPVKQSQVLTNAVDGQTSFKIRVLQGEREFACDNRYLAEFTLNNLPPLPMCKARIEITFSVDEDGILKVSATELLTGKAQTIEINPHYGLKRETVQKMVEDSLTSLTEDMKKRSVTDAQKHAERVLQVLRKALAEHEPLLIGSEKEIIDEHMQLIARSIQKCDSIEIREATEELERVAEPFLKRRLDFLFKKMEIDLNKT
ncbi:chaperone protein [Neorickettsia risticii str. Illinois]|uniref:Chaperone protein n=1 Tax=Neorickettsia risticii (strain Illinois) TaxID=434131 RepID=C6V4G0_NEORI|nr:Hsp70 family protein [Neorickettsia risticii]ACT69283.1 chaperone protein [Neorickettsia risticii str. Illinois]